MNTEQTFDNQLNPQPEPPAPQNFFSRLIGVYFSPSDTFKEIGNAPRLLIPLLLLAVLGGFMNFIVTHRYGAENVARKQVEPMMRSMGVPEDKIEEAVQQTIASSQTTWGKIKGPLSGAFGFIVMILIVAGVFKLFTLMMGTTNRFKPLLSVISFAYLAITLIQVILTTIIVYLKNPEDIDLFNPVSSNLGGLLTVAGVALPKFIGSLANFIDVFGIWRIVLLGIGCASVTHKMKPMTAAIPHIILYVIAALLLSVAASMMG